MLSDVLSTDCTLSVYVVYPEELNEALSLVKELILPMWYTPAFSLHSGGLSSGKCVGAIDTR